MLREVITNVTNESSLSRIYKHTLEHDSGTITAFRSSKDCNEGEKFTKSENKKNNSILKAKLLKLGYGVTAIDGVYIENFKSDNEIEVKEESFIVVDLKDKGTLKKDLVQLGTLFEQDSIGFGLKGGKDFVLVSSNECPNGYPGFGKIGKEEKLGKALFGNKGEFLSKVNGRPFVFSESISETVTITSFYPSEIRSILKLADSY